MATPGSRHRRRRVRLAGLGLVGVLALVATACDGGANSAARGGGASEAAAASDPGAASPSPTSSPATTPPSAPSPPSSTPVTPPGSSSGNVTKSGSSEPSGASGASGASSDTTLTPAPTQPAGPPSPASPSSPSTPSEPPADETAGPAGPGAAWRNALAGDLAQWSSTPACSSQAAAPIASAAAPVRYVAVTEGPSGRPEAHSFTVTSAADKSAQLEALAQTSGPVTSFEVDTGVQEVTIDDPVYKGPPSSSFGPQWQIDKVKYETAWGVGLAQGAGVRVAIVDSGVQADHEDLGRTESGGAVAPGADFLSSSVPGDERTDSGSHGTHVAGIVGARDNTIGGIGGAPKVTIVPVRVLNGGSGSIANVTSGILWAADPALGDADVINLSLGSSQCSETLFDALQFAVSKGATIVAAAGNCSCTTERLYPAAFSTMLSGVIAVASTDINNLHSSFSNVNDYLTISAPGTGIWSTIPANGYGLKSGTSMASPGVAAVAALVKAKCPGISPAKVRTQLTSNAQALGAANQFGAGLVRADLAVGAACPAP